MERMTTNISISVGLPRVITHVRILNLFSKEHPLAENFNLFLGSVTIGVPDVEPGEDYFIVCEFHIHTVIVIKY